MHSEFFVYWYQGELVIDGKTVPNSLMDLVKDTLRANPRNSVIGFNDNSRYVNLWTKEIIMLEY
jgi:phosphoribosylformylglycinamidine synthase